MNIVRSLVRPQYLFRPARSAARLVKGLRRNGAQRVEVRLPWGVSIRVNTGERIGGAIWRSGVHDLPVAETLWRLLDAGDAAIDVGANLGYTASLMASRVGRTGRVICFEPQPEVFQELQANIALVRREPAMGEIEAHQIALSDRLGEATLVCQSEFDRDHGASRIDDGVRDAGNVRHLTVATNRLDDVVDGRRIALVKIDVEGHELAVLQGAERILMNGRIEHVVYEDFGGPESPVHRLLREYGYSVYGLGWATHRPLLTDVVEGPAIDTAWESPNYLATLAPSKVLARFRRWGWSVI